MKVKKSISLGGYMIGNGESNWSRRQFIAGTSALVCGLAVNGKARARSEKTLDFSNVTKRLETVVKRGTVPWVAFLVTKGGEDLYAHAVGTELAHVDVLRSATKLVSVTALMTLVDRCMISLDDPASRYI